MQNPVELSDRELVNACRRGEERAMELLYHRYKRRVYGVVTRIAGYNDADEVAQEVFVRIYRGLERFRGDSALSTWVYRLATNASLTYIGKRGRRNRGVEEFIEAPAAPEVFRDSSLQEILSTSLAELPPGYRAILVLHDVEGLSHEECADILGCRIGTSKSQLHKARAKMRKILEPKLVKEDTLR